MGYPIEARLSEEEANRMSIGISCCMGCFVADLAEAKLPGQGVRRRLDHDYSRVCPLVLPKYMVGFLLTCL